MNLTSSTFDKASRANTGVTLSRAFTLVGAIVLTLFVLVFAGRLWENVGASEVVVIQAPVSGKLTWLTSPGVYWQGGGKVTSYQRRREYDFEIQVRFNDGGHGTMHGSVQWEMPLDEKNLTALHTRFGSSDAIQAQLVENAVNKSVYMTGPLMSSKESYAEKRNYLINYVEDQISNGVYKTIQHEVKVQDPLTGQDKTAVVVDIMMTNNVPQRQEASSLNEFGIRTFGFAIKALPYDDDVEKQIKQQQQLAMDVQTAISEARKAEQRKITTEQQGMADAAKAKWDQEVVKAKFVTEAQQKLEVSQLDNQTAEQYRQATLKRADADAGYRKQVMTADGALQARLDTYLKVSTVYADAIKNHQGPWVPSVVMGNGAAGGNAAGASSLIDMLTAKTAMELGLEMGTQRQKGN